MNKTARPTSLAVLLTNLGFYLHTFAKTTTMIPSIFFFLKTVRVERYKRLRCIDVLMYCCTVKNATNTRQLHSAVFSDVNGQQLSLYFGCGWFDAKQISECVRCCLFMEENVSRRVVPAPFKGFPVSLYFSSSKLLFALQPETTFAR